jgi:two-component sensor histidine kinase
VSAYRRLGLTADLVGAHLGAVTTALAPPRGAVDEALSVVVSGRAPRRVDVEGNANVVALRAIPVRLEGVRIGGLVLCRDVTELRRRERELVTKDATIREIHHRVKNNLQTVAALLRLQARRLDEPTGRGALEEAVRRVGAIALVHEVLSRALDETVDFDGIAEQLAGSMVDVAVVGAGGEPPSVRLEGSFGTLPAEVATPLALVLTELLQNALEHGAPQGGAVVVDAARATGRLRVTVADEGPGLPDGFDLDRSRSLGLQIVRALVEAELDGELALASPPGGGTRARVELPLPLPQP